MAENNGKEIDIDSIIDKLLEVRGYSYLPYERL